MSKIDSVIADIEAVIEKLGGVQSRLREIKDDAEAVEKARDSLRGPKKSQKRLNPHDHPPSCQRSASVECPVFCLSFQTRACFVERRERIAASE